IDDTIDDMEMRCTEDPVDSLAVAGTGERVIGALAGGAGRMNSTPSVMQPAAHKFDVRAAGVRVVEIADDDSRRRPGWLPGGVAHQLCRLDPRSRAPMIEMGVEKDKFATGDDV